MSSAIQKAPAVTIRRLTYWLLFVWLLFLLCVNAEETYSVFDQWDTYRRVYRKPWLYLAAEVAFGLLHGIALALHTRGWRTARFSRTAVAASPLFAGFVALHATVGVFETCCS